MLKPKKRNVKSKEKGRILNNRSRFLILPIASLLYSYSIISIAGLVAIIAICLIRGDFVVFEEISLKTAITIIVGIVIFFPVRKFRKGMFDNL